MTQRTRQFKDDAYADRLLRRCHYCALSMLRHHATVDHKVPESQGGATRRSNFVLACGRCNAAKGTTPYEIFKALMLPEKRQRLAKERPRGR